jgi:hypothetical protein
MRRNVRLERSRKPGHVRHLLRDRGARARSPHRGLAGQHLVHDTGEAINVARVTEIWLAARLLGAHVLGSPHGDAGIGHPVGVRRRADAGDAEIGQQGVAVGEQHVLRLYIPMHELVAMRVVEPRPHFLRDPERLLQWQSFLDVEPLAQGTARDERLDVVEHTVRLARVDERHDVRVGEPCGDADLPQEPLGAEGSGEPGPQDFDGDLTAVLAVFGQVDRRHAAATNLPLDHISVGEGGGEGGERVCHGGNDGADGIRTHDPLVANQVLSQLSYRPMIGQ